jgi:hypothetical protein
MRLCSKYEYSRSNVLHNESNCAAKSADGGVGAVGALLEPPQPHARTAADDTNTMTKVRHIMHPQQASVTSTRRSRISASPVR